MSVTAKCLIESKYAPNSVTTEYTAPTGRRVIIDKFTATNTDASSQTITVSIVEAAGTPGAQHTIVSAKSISAGETADLSVLQNQILNANDFVRVVVSIASKVVIRMSGREIL